MSECGGLWKHENNQHAIVPPEMECGCPSGGGIKNSHIHYPSYGGKQKGSQHHLYTAVDAQHLSLCSMVVHIRITPLGLIYVMESHKIDLVLTLNSYLKKTS